MRKSMFNFSGIVIMLMTGWIFLCSTVYADWAFSFVVHDGDIYVVTEQLVSPEAVGSKIGEVTSYSDREGTYSGNFSNTYVQGTEYYELQEETERAIAIKEKQGTYRKAVYEGQYAGNSLGGSKGRERLLSGLSWA